MLVYQRVLVILGYSRYITNAMIGFVWKLLVFACFRPIDCKESDDDWAPPLDFTPIWRPKCPSCRYFCRNIEPTSSDQAVVDFVGQPAHPDDTIPDLCQGGSHSRSSLQRMWSTVVASEFSIIKYNKHNMVWKLLRKNGQISGVGNCPILGILDITL